MPVMPRRRPPPRRTSSSSSSSRRNMETRNLVTANPFGAVELGGFLRATLLGAFVGGLVIFLFYPDISRLMERWQNSSELSGQLGRAGVDKGAHGDGASARAANSNKEEKIRSHTKRGGSPARKTREPKPARKDRGCPQESTPCPCQCSQPVRPPPSCGPPTPTPKKTRRTKQPTKAPEDLMEEEVVEEEDPVEVQLMEEDEPVEFIDLEPEENIKPVTSPATDETSDSGSPAVDTEKPLASQNARSDGDEQLLTPEDSPPSSAGTKEEPITLTDGQPITFTPVSPGDENIIRVGGRPKPGEDASRQTATKPQTNAFHPNKQNSSAKTSPSSTSSGKVQKSEAASSKRSQTNQESSSTKTAAGKDSKVKDSTKEGSLPEEVRNFQPSYLRTVTAKKIFADGRRIPPVELQPQKESNSSVRVFLFNEFLSEAECEGLKRVHNKHVHEMASNPLLCFDSLGTLRKHLRDVKRNLHVTPNDFVEGTKCLNATFSRRLGTWMGGNWSYSTAFYPGESRFSSIFAARVEEAMGLGPRNGGKFQITSYPTGKAYKAHTDCMLEGGDPRDRVATVLVYLDDVEDGGETKFPELGIWVKPRKGRALVWNNMSPEGVCEPNSLHVASKVNSGSKYILIRWYYYKGFFSLGKRPPEPPLPARPPGTPRVSCDDYDNGSCRWYDEWNNDHLLDYEYKRYTLI